MWRSTTTAFFIFFLSVFAGGLLLAQQTYTLSLNLVDKKLPFGLTQKVQTDLPQIGLALSGGGARCFSQLGVLKAFEEKNIPINIITGTSMGSIIGGLYSAGYSFDDLDSIVFTASWDDFFSIKERDRNELFVDQKITQDKAIFALRLDGLKPIIPTSVNTGQMVSNFLNLLSINAPIHVESGFDDLLFKFRAVCTDLVTGDEIIVGDGLLSQAMRASSSVSLLLAPVRRDSMLLVDGGLVANVPVNAAKISNADYIIAVNTTSPLHTMTELNYPWNIADQLVSIPMKKLNEDQLENADVTITPDLGYHSNTDFTRIDSLIKKGYETALPLADFIADTIKTLYKESLSTDKFFIKNLTTDDEPNEFEREIVRKYSSQDSICSGDLYYDLYSLYNTGNFESLTFNLIEDSVKTMIKILYNENPVVNQIGLRGVTLINYNAAYNKLSSLLHKPYNVNNVLTSAIKLLREYRIFGYSLAEIENIIFDSSSQTLVVNISEGAVSKIIVEGNQKTDKELITREIPLKEGEHFKYENVQRGLANLRATNLFDDIDLFLTKDFGENILKIKVHERISSLVRFGLRIDNEYLTQVLVDIRDENLFGTGTELGAMFIGGIRNQSYTLEHRVNRVFNTYLTYSLQVFFESQDINVYYPDTSAGKNELSRKKVFQYTQSFLGTSFGIGTQIGRFGNIILEGKYQHAEVGNIPNITAPILSLDLFSLNLSLNIDSQNKYPYPTKGYLLKTYYETAQSILAGDLGYTKFYFDYKNIFSLNTMHTFSARLKAGFSDRTLPLSEYFSIGGQNSFFGLRDHEFRNRQIFTTSLEYQVKLPFTIFFDTYCKLRYDLGATWFNPEEIKFQSLLHGIGATISLNTPIGPADFSIGKSFTFLKSSRGSTIAWGDTFFYFTIGYYY